MKSILWVRSVENSKLNNTLGVTLMSQTTKSKSLAIILGAGLALGVSSLPVTAFANAQPSLNHSNHIVLADNHAEKDMSTDMKDNKMMDNDADMKDHKSMDHDADAKDDKAMDKDGDMKDKKSMDKDGDKKDKKHCDH